MLYESPAKCDWVESLPKDYFHRMEACVRRQMPGFFDSLRDDYAQYFLDGYVYGRMSQCYQSVRPWLEASIGDLGEKRVLEVGCGNGSSTAPIAMACKDVIAFDIDPQTLEIARERCRLLGVENVDIRHEDTSWITRYHDDSAAFGGRKIEMVFAYALFEHLLPMERILFLRAVWKQLPVGGHLVTVELPNRLFYFDWHSSQTNFADMLPAELSYLNYGLASERPNVPTDIVARRIGDLDAASRENLFRFGRGASYHEFEFALGHDAYEVVGASQSPDWRKSINREWFYGEHGHDWEAVLSKILQAGTPPIHPAFAAPSLDLILEKKGEAATDRG